MRIKINKKVRMALVWLFLLGLIGWFLVKIKNKNI